MPRESAATTNLSNALNQRYQRQAWAFDWTRGPILLRRRALARLARTGESVLEVGCGTGRLLPDLCGAVGPHGRVVGVECAAAMALRAEKRARKLPQARVVRGEYPHAPAQPPFDLILFSYSLSMMADPANALHAAANALKPTGRLAILDFTTSRWSFMRRCITAAGVDLDTNRAALAAEVFTIADRTRHSGYGLWSYELLLGRRLKSRTDPN